MAVDYLITCKNKQKNIHWQNFPGFAAKEILLIATDTCKNCHCNSATRHYFFGKGWMVDNFVWQTK